MNDDEQQTQCDICGASEDCHRASCPMRDDESKWRITEAEVDG